jgi:hypothetical protein
LDIASHALRDFWIPRHCLHARIPRLFCYSFGERFVLQCFVSLHPLLKLNDLQWVSGGGESLGKKRIGIQRNRRNQRIQLIIQKLWRFFGGRRRGRHHLRLRLRRGLRNGRVVGRERSHACEGDRALK